MKGYSVYRRPGRPVWYVCFFCPDRLRWRSEATAFRLDDPAGKRKAVRLAEGKVRDFELLRRGVRGHGWSAWVPAFFAERYRAQPLTLQRYLNAWQWLQVWLMEAKIRQPAALQYRHAQAYLDWRLVQRRHCGKPVRRNTALVELRVLSLVMREAVRRDFATGNPLDRLGLRRDAAGEKPELTDSDIARIRAGLQAREGGLPVNERWMTVSFEIALHQGCRLRETSVPMTQVDLVRGTITFDAKGRNGRAHVFTTALHPGLRPLLEELKAAGAERTCILPRMAAREWWGLRKELGLGHTTFHSTRVTVITRLARAGIPQAQAMRFVGHANEAVHRIYQRLKVEDLGNCLGALDYSGPKSAGNPGGP
jgi:integrase